MHFLSRDRERKASLIRRNRFRQFENKIAELEFRVKAESEEEARCKKAEDEARLIELGFTFCRCVGR